jgi:hypothetical protein
MGKSEWRSKSQSEDGRVRLEIEKSDWRWKRKSDWGWEVRVEMVKLDWSWKSQIEKESQTSRVSLTARKSDIQVRREMNQTDWE